MLHMLKYDGMLPIASKLGESLASRLASQAGLPKEMSVIPVPLFKDRQKQRGFNQSELLANATIYSMRAMHPEWRGQLAAKVLQRSRTTQSQAGLSLSERRRNLRGAFFVPDAELIRGRHVLLVDDIYTTGATARACSSVLKRAGTASIWVATVARAQRYDTLLRYDGGTKQGTTGAGSFETQDMSKDVALWEGTIH